MRVFVFALAAVTLAACSQQAPAPAAEEPQLATFEDNGCIGVLLAHRGAVIQNNAEGDPAALTAALENWRTEALKTLSADELAQFEASSFAVEQGVEGEDLAARSATCVTTAPPN